MCEISQFADDTSLYTCSKSISEIQNRLNNDLVLISNWLRNHKLHLNVSKTKVVLFGSRRALSKVQSLNVNISGKVLQQVETIKYLGVILDNCLSWKPHITNLHVRNKTSRIVGMLRRLHHIVPFTTIQILYNTIVLPSLDYCDVVWSGCSQEDSNKLEVVHNNRAITGAPYRCSATAEEEIGMANSTAEEDLPYSNVDISMFKSSHSSIFR